MPCHDIVEHDPVWREFYCRIKGRITEVSKIHIVDSVKKTWNGCLYNAYADIRDVVDGKVYDVISIDGPKGSERHSRRDVLGYIPDILGSSFCIVMHDAERGGEKATIEEIKTELKKRGVNFCVGTYPSISTVCVIASEDNQFLCSL